MNCCEQSGMKYGCNQGRDCPKRAASDDDGNPLGQDETFTLLMLIYIALMVVCIVLLAAVCGAVGYVYTTFGDQISDAFWHWMALIS